MRITHRRSLVGGIALMTGLAMVPGLSQATPPAGVVGTPLVRGSFTDDVGATFTVKLSTGGRRTISAAKDASQVAFQDFTFDPGGSTGWHSHPGPVIVLVKSGALTYYTGPGCVARTYPAGTAFIDSGDGNPHLARNESGVTTQTSVVYFGVPLGESPRIDEVAPGSCPP